MKLPRSGATRAEVMTRLRESMREDAPWNRGRTFYLVYGVDDEHVEMLREAHSLFIQTNGLGAGGMFPSLATLESDVVRIAAELLGRPEAVGNITSGGTESILMAIRSALERARAERPRIARPEMVLPATAHPAFQKAAQVYGIRTVRVPLNAEYTVDPDAVARAVNENTVVIVGSAPNYPFGTIDPIADLAAIAQARGISFHADCSVGAFSLPFLRRLGETVPPFDFAVPGVSTISADIHKYGFGERGTSVILYRDEALQSYAKFTLDEWCGGPYRTATLAGSRPGAIVATAWAILNYFGEEGYLRLNREMLETTRALQEGIGAIPGFRVLGRPAMHLFAFAAEHCDINAVGDGLAERRWYVHKQPTDPPSLHLVVTPIHAPVVQDFLLDLRTVAAEVARTGRVSRQAANYGAD